MRLQVAILRNQLPPVRLLFNTSKQHGPGSQPLTTIADLLFALNALVPLESTRDGEWGFEDYVVEVAATSDQDFAYECLHYQEINDVLHEDDEVVVRALSSIDLRDRRLGGRLQISNDGRHLIDGLSWGSRWRGQAARPDIDIPPRKRRRITLTEEEAVPQIEHLTGQEVSTQLEFLTDDKDDESDEDFFHEQSANSSSSAETSDDASNEEEPKPTLQIMASEMFDNADGDSDAVSENSLISQEDLAEELNEILQDSDVLNVTSRARRRKDRDTGHDRLNFEGFSSSEASPVNKLKTLRRLEHSQNHGTDSDDKINSSSSKSDADETDETSSTDSSSDNSSENQDDTDSENSKSEDSEKSDSSSDDDSDETSSSSSSASDENGGMEFPPSTLRQPGIKHNHAAVAKQSTLVDSALLSVPEQTYTKISVPPGSGTLKTKRNNDRKKMGRQLKHLKAEGKIDINANYDDLREYNRINAVSGASELEESNTEDLTNDVLATRKQLLLSQLHSVSTDSENVQTNLTPSLSEDTSRKALLHEQPQADGSSGHNIPSAEHSEHLIKDKAITTSPQPKSRLDLASSRRMLFNSLGVRNPKTAAAEQAVREQLSKPSRNVKSKQETPAKSWTASSSHQSDAWRDKLVVSAVECVQKGRKIPTPPFPFKHPWQVRKENSRVSERQISSSMDHRELDYEENDALAKTGSGDFRVVNEGTDSVAVASAISRTITAGTDKDDELTMPEEPQNLLPLRLGEFGENSIIVYKELHMNSRFEPEESSYRIARVLGVEGSVIQVLLSKKDRSSTEAEYDEDTGERIYGKFEVPLDDDDEADNGYREFSFDQMIDPRIVAVSSVVQVTSSDRQTTQNEEQHKDHQSSAERALQFVPESGLAIEINQGIEDGDFPSQLDENLLRPIEHSAETDQYIARKTANGQMIHLREETGDYANTLSSAERSKTVLSAAAQNRQHDRNEQIDERENHSEFDGNSLSKPKHTESSSHQDAQRLSSANLAYEEGSVVQTPSWDNRHEIVHDITASTLKQAKMLQTDKNSNGISPLIETVQENGMSHIDNEAENDLSLPSLRAIVSSQNRESSHRRTSTRLSTRSPSSSDRVLRSQDRNPSSSPAPNSDPEAQSSELSLKPSQSQQARISQIPQHDGTIDLTISSDILEPIDNELNTDTGPNDKRKTRQSTRNVGSSGFSSRAFKSSFTGLGSKTMLHSKKTINHP